MSPLSFRVFESSTPKYKQPVAPTAPSTSAAMLASLQQDLAEAHSELTRLRQAAVRDPITGGANMRALSMAWEGQDPADPLSLLMIDIDGFRRVNRTLGRACGDAVLKAVTTTMERALRWDDVVAREGADRFIVMLPLAIEEDAFAVAERIRESIAKMCFEVAQGRFKLTIRAGVASRRDGDELETLIGRTERACREGKTMGGNTISFE
jgi:diguanylate cyclase